MTTERNDSGPAFPRDHAVDGHNGMTLRDYFAAKAMISIITSRTDSVYLIEPQWNIESNTGLHAARENFHRMLRQHFSETAIRAYDMADAMLKAREQ